MTTDLSRLETHGQCMGRMLLCCGIEPARLAQDRCGLTLGAAARACLACGHVDRCRRWLAEADGAGDDIAGAPPFCPNAGRFNNFHGS